MAQNYINSGKVFDYTAAGTITSGQAILIGTRLGIALKGGVSGDIIPVKMSGVFQLAKNTGASTNFAQGGIVYWDAAASKITGVASGNTAIGVAAETAATTDATGKVKLYC